MLYDILKQEICRVLPFEPTFQQAEAIESLSRFLVSPVSDAAFILRGYAGTGKTSLVSAIVRMLNQIHRTVVLLAPTGRAAKVFRPTPANRPTPSIKPFTGNVPLPAKIRLSIWDTTDCVTPYL